MHPVLGAATNETIEAAGRVTVTDVTIEPSVLMTGDVGLITFTVENTGQSNVAISDAQLVSKDIVVLNSDVYKSSRVIGSGTKTKFTFTILANQPENIYYPAFYINYKDAGSLRYNVPVRVEEPQLAVSVSGIPQVFTKGVTTRLTLLVGNAKSVNMTGITILPSGEGIQCNRTSAFIGDLPPHSEKAILFEVTPSQETDLTFHISYTCGMNTHETAYSIHIPLGTDKLAADPLINNIEITSGTRGNTIAGDVSNAGLSDAYGVVVALESAADESGNPNQKYVIGTISSGDFASFEITVPQNMRTIPLVILYKDSSGNQFSKNISIDTQEVNGGSGSILNSATGSFPGNGNPPSGFPSGEPSGQSGKSGPSGRTNPMNPLSGMGSGMSSLPVMEILYGIGILLGIVIIWRIWKRMTNGRKIRFRFK
ncbi:hypothetical protein [Methanospirillum sp.]|uniref:hypothetical protein n=2 Tax=Methanospirillum sp. TaxID=45200 RepID=UPI002CC08236|nr:hypothetical protein [Methanospirillum sp.]HPP77822.1 hypothetical protein [Methanospirillum sp.]